MKNKISIIQLPIILVFFLSFQFFSCTQDKLAKPFHSRQIDNQLTWTAFKYTDRTALSGSFDNIYINYIKYDNVIHLLETLSFEIMTHSINSKLSTRDFNITEFFFKQLIDNYQITGEVIRVIGDQTEGTCIFDLTLNGVTKEVSTRYRFDNEMISLDGHLNLADWECGTALDFLNSKVIEYHTGADGQNKLWSDVAFKVERALD